MTPSEIADALEKKFGDRLLEKKLDVFDPWVRVAPADLVEVATFLRDDPALQFDYLRNLTGVDYLLDEKKAKKANIEPRLELVYHLFSFAKKHEITLKAFLDRWKDGKAGALPEAPTLGNVWAVSHWHEREVYDLVGVRFIGHTNLRRILCPEDWVGHPLRKDYEFPTEYHGIRCQ